MAAVLLRASGLLPNHHLPSEFMTAPAEALPGGNDPAQGFMAVGQRARGGAGTAQSLPAQNPKVQLPAIDHQGHEYQHNSSNISEL